MFLKQLSHVLQFSSGTEYGQALYSWVSDLAPGVTIREAKTLKIFMDEAGSFLGHGEGCLIVRDKKRRVEKYPLFENEIGEVQIRIGNSVSSAALATCAFWAIDVLISTQRGNSVAVLK